MISKDIGIVIFGYNRPSHLMRVLIALEDYKRGLKTMKYHLMEPTPNYVKDDRIRFV